MICHETTPISGVYALKYSRVRVFHFQLGIKIKRNFYLLKTCVSFSDRSLKIGWSPNPRRATFGRPIIVSPSLKEVGNAILAISERCARFATRRKRKLSWRELGNRRNWRKRLVAPPAPRISENFTNLSDTSCDLCFNFLLGWYGLCWSTLILFKWYWY